MYDLINAHIQDVLETIREDEKFVTEYDWLVEKLHKVAESDYQARYRNYWAMNAARLSSNWYKVYFQKLQDARNNVPSIGDLTRELYQHPTQAKGRRSLQFSFATKLLHMVNPHFPIYDSHVSDFYCYQQKGGDAEDRISGLIEFHDFLTKEYARIIKNSLLSQSIAKFRELLQQLRSQLQPESFTDERLIDSLIWAFMDLLNGGGVIKGQVIYH
jgi:hypothetical protein